MAWSPARAQETSASRAGRATTSSTQVANVTNIEGLVLNAGGSDVTLTNSLVAGTSTGFFWILGGAGSDTVDASAISNGTAVSFIAGSGADTFKGGNGRNDSVFAADELTSADTVTGGSAIDTLYFLTPGRSPPPPLRTSPISRAWGSTPA